MSSLFVWMSKNRRFSVNSNSLLHFRNTLLRDATEDQYYSFFKATEMVFHGIATTGLLLLSFAGANAGANLGELTATYHIAGGYHAGIAYDTIQGRLLLASLVSDSIIALDPVTLGINSIIGIDPEYHGGLLYTYIPDAFTVENRVGLGLKFEERTGDVLVAMSNFETFDDGGWAVYTLHDDTSTAWLRDSFRMPCTNVTSDCGLAGDLVVDVEDDDGRVYCTDAVNGRIFQSHNGNAKELVISDPSLLLGRAADGPFPFPFGSNGMVMTEKGTLLVSNSGAGTLVTIDLTTGKSTNVEIRGESGHGWGLLYAKRRLYVITGTVIYVLDSDDDWLSATVLGGIDIDKSADGETATTGAFGPMDERGDPMEIYVTYVRFNELFGEGPSDDDTSTLGLVTLNGNNRGSSSASEVVESNGNDEILLDSSRTGTTIWPTQDEESPPATTDTAEAEIEIENMTQTETAKDTEIGKNPFIEVETETVTDASISARTITIGVISAALLNLWMNL
ncbi:hypothetical protein ACHAXS_003613 [Conticribra weissflogii]